MPYKTMVLELLQQLPEVHEQLRQQRMVLAALEFYASELKSLHQAWTQHLTETSPDSNPSQTANQALEFALGELEDYLPASPPNPGRPSIEDLMNFLQDHTPPA